MIHKKNNWVLYPIKSGKLGENRVCCSFGQKEAEMLYNAGYRKMDEVLKENQRLKHCCNVLTKALDNVLGIDHNYTNVYKEAEEELRREESSDAD